MDHASDLAKFESINKTIDSFIDKHTKSSEWAKEQVILSLGQNPKSSVIEYSIEMKSSHNVIFHLEMLKAEVNRERADGQAQNRLDRIKDLILRTLLDNSPEVGDDAVQTQMKHELFAVLGQINVGPIQR